MSERRRGLPRQRLRAPGLLAWVVAAPFVLPLVVLPIRAFAQVWRAPAIIPQEFGTRGFAYAFSSAAGAGPALVNSLVVGVATTVLALLIGWPAARCLGASSGHTRRLVFSLVALPLLVPPFAVGTGLTEWYLRLGLADTGAGLVLAHLVYVLPYVVLLLAPAFGAEVTELEEAARSLGAGTLERLRLVTVPAVAPALGAATLIGFLVSWSQYGTSLAVGGGHPTLPVVLLPFVGSDQQVAATLALLFLAPAVLALVVTTRLQSTR